MSWSLHSCIRFDSACNLRTPVNGSGGIEGHISGGDYRTFRIQIDASWTQKYAQNVPDAHIRGPLVNPAAFVRHGAGGRGAVAPGWLLDPQLPGLSPLAFVRPISDRSKTSILHHIGSKTVPCIYILWCRQLLSLEYRGWVRNTHWDIRYMIATNTQFH